MTNDTRTWLITGASRGFGRVWAQAALARGERVTATARDVTALAGLVADYGDAVLPLALDVTDRAACHAAVAAAHERFGRLDVLVNNAGFGHFGMVEEATEPEARAQLETNLFGALWVTQAALPIMRAHGGGHILQVSSIGGVAAFPNLGLYHASKWALEGLSEALAQEVSGHGIKVTLVEPGPFGTDWAGSSAVHSEPIAAYDEVREARARSRAAMAPGDPQATAEAIRTLVDAGEPPLRLFLGTMPLPTIERIYAGRLATWRAWSSVADAAQGAQPAPLT
jgi:NAD(P)-dependent dehydrogenase (short-subunit alcohol dehydrogenase family)